jgi:pSer/pThr/pTyr-binding forkhead associated (FHA) protein
MSIEKTMAGSGAKPMGGPLPPGLRVSLLDAAGRTLLVRRTPVTIGRKNADIVIPDATVSSLHAVLERSENGFALIDKGSTNGTFVNGARVTSAAVGNLDEVRFGDVTFTLSVVEDRFGMHEESAPTDTSQTLLIASAPTVAPIPSGKTYMLFAETGGVEQAIRLQLRLTTVGRSEGDLNIEDQALSRRHFQIEVHPEHLAIKDLGSVNGTHIQGKPVSYTRLAPGQEFTAGRTRFRIEVRG